MTTPNPRHPITWTTNPKRVRVQAAGHVIADTADALTLNEAGYGPVQYLPRRDIETGFLSPSPKVTQCPYKGAATHYSILIDGALIENVAWSYEDPLLAVEAIRGRIAFYPDKVEVYEVDEEALKHHQRT
ncbi:MAG TPA: DUF427 domain-containing protein [Caulobacteraceae bacterium]|jgi:uncharacterized protein (DUF427 family)|nr:DUF427 domain-containing protein [Caulobacteraceae bacterium]